MTPIMFWSYWWKGVQEYCVKGDTKCPPNAFVFHMLVRWEVTMGRLSRLGGVSQFQRSARFTMQSNFNKNNAWEKFFTIIFGRISATSYWVIRSLFSTVFRSNSNRLMLHRFPIMMPHQIAPKIHRNRLKNVSEHKSDMIRTFRTTIRQLPGRQVQGTSFVH